MKNAPTCALLVAVAGLCLFGSSFVMPQVASSQDEMWTEDDAKEFQRLGRDLHAASMDVGFRRQDNPNYEPPPEFNRLKDSYDQKQQQLSEAQNAGKLLAKVLFISGIVLTVVGGGAYLAFNTADDD